MLLSTNIFRRAHVRAAAVIAPFADVPSRTLDMPGMLSPRVSLFEPACYQFARAELGALSLLDRQPRLHRFDVDRLAGCLTTGVNFPFAPVMGARVPLLASVRVAECLHSAPPRTGAIHGADYAFIPPPLAKVHLVPSPDTANVPPEISQQPLETSALCLDPTLSETAAVTHQPFAITPPSVADCSWLLAHIIQVSLNLHKPLGRAAAGGKHYSGASRTCRPSLGIGGAIAQDRAAGTSEAYRKSYSERPRCGGGVTRQEMSIWDLLLPLLQPPLGDLGSAQVILPAELLPHQPEGVRFLATTEGALLGDGVQTGKTVQTIVAMKLLFQAGKIRSALVVCPIPLLLHWQKQLEKWAPELWQGLTVVRNPSRDDRRLRWRMAAHIYATNYETLVADSEEIQLARPGKGFDLIVADEIQRIKNRRNGFEQLRLLGNHAKYRWGLSATPIENSLEDLVSIFDFLKPGLLRRNSETELSASKKIKPYFLRRKTEDVAKQFKEPRHDNIFVRMEGAQLDAYERAFKESVAELTAMGDKVTLTHALAKLQALKQLCNLHPPSGQSAKLEWLMETAEEIKASGNKALVFTQYVECGRDFLARQLDRFGCVIYDSQEPDARKQRSVRDFSEDPAKALFLANPKVAGVGLPDLKAANYVIHFDHWWNPAVEAQANGRILGIGQMKDAFIIHLWVENSIEGKIQSILARKRDLFGRVIDSQSSVNGTGLTEDELFEVLGLKAPPKRPEGGRNGADAGGQSQIEKVAPLPSNGAVRPQDLSPQEFETLIAKLYAAMGYTVSQTPQSRDGGIDVIAIRDHPTGRDKLAIQCKRQEKPVGRPELQKLLGVISSDPSFSDGVLVTTSSFSTDARLFAEQNGRLKLVDKSTLANLLVQTRVAVTQPRTPGR